MNEINSELNAKIVNYLESNQKENWLLTEYKRINQTRQEYQSLVPELDKKEQSFLLSEIKELTEQESRIILQIKEQMITEERTEQDIIMEIRPGIGGDEAGLFAQDLYRMYLGFAQKKGWKIKEIESRVGRQGEFNSVFFIVEGKNTFSWLKNEAGIHRVKREPETGKGGKTHTSTASVVVLPPLKDIEADILPKNLKIETYGSSGPGGQHANKTESAARATYTYLINGKTETITAVSQSSRNQIQNKKEALLVLKKRLWERKQNEQNREARNLRSAMIGTAERSEKVRTYDFFKNRVTDHRLGISWEEKVEFIIEGDLEEVCQKLIDYEVEKKIN